MKNRTRNNQVVPVCPRFWPRAISSVVHLFYAVSSKRTSADAEQHNASYADVNNFIEQKPSSCHLFFFIFYSSVVITES